MPARPRKINLRRLEDGETVAIKSANEVGFTICQKDGRIARGPAVEGTHTKVSIPLRCPRGYQPVGLFHTHPGGTAYPSPVDVAAARQAGIRNLCIAANGKLKCYRV